MNQLLKFLEGAFKFLPRWLTDSFVKGLVAIVYLFVKKLKHICRKNLRSVFGNTKEDAEYRAMTKSCIQNIGYGMADLLYYVERPKELSAIVKLQNEENIKQALSKGQGVIAVSAHMGNFPLMFIFLSQKGYKVNVVIRAMRDKNFSKFMFNICHKWGINMIQTAPAKEFLRESLGALKRNELLFILLDEFVAADKGIQVPFFNGQVARATGPVQFLERTGAPIVPMFIVKDEENHFKIFAENIFVIHSEGSKEEIVFKNITGLTKIIEAFVSRYPLQWGGWLNKRWAQST